NKIEVRDAKSMKITSLTLHFFEPVHLALLFPRQKKKNPQPVARKRHKPEEIVAELRRVDVLFDGRQNLAHPRLVGAPRHVSEHARMGARPASPVKKNVTWQWSHGRSEIASP